MEFRGAKSGPYGSFSTSPQKNNSHAPLLQGRARRLEEDKHFYNKMHTDLSALEGMLKENHEGLHRFRTGFGIEGSLSPNSSNTRKGSSFRSVKSNSPYENRMKGFRPRTSYYKGRKHRKQREWEREEEAKMLRETADPVILNMKNQIGYMRQEEEVRSIFQRYIGELQLLRMKVLKIPMIEGDSMKYNANLLEIEKLYGNLFILNVEVRKHPLAKHQLKLLSISQMISHHINTAMFKKEGRMNAINACKIDIEELAKRLDEMAESIEQGRDGMKRLGCFWITLGLIKLINRIWRQYKKSENEQGMHCMITNLINLANTPIYALEPSMGCSSEGDLFAFAVRTLDHKVRKNKHLRNSLIKWDKSTTQSHSHASPMGRGKGGSVAGERVQRPREEHKLSPSVNKHSLSKSRSPVSKSRMSRSPKSPGTITSIQEKGGTAKEPSKSELVWNELMAKELRTIYIFPKINLIYSISVKGLFVGINQKYMDVPKKVLSSTDKIKRVFPLCDVLWYEVCLRLFEKNKPAGTKGSNLNLQNEDPPYKISINPNQWEIISQEVVKEFKGEEWRSKSYILWSNKYPDMGLNKVGQYMHRDQHVQQLFVPTIYDPLEFFCGFVISDGKQQHDIQANFANAKNLWSI